MKTHGNITNGAFSNMRELYRVFRQHDGPVTVSVTKRRPPRTLAQNSYLWGVVYKTIGEWIGDTEEAVHDKYDEILDLRKYTDEHDRRRIKSTAQMTTEELSKYIEKLKLWAWHEHQLYIPEPNDQA